jgi:hypothetical protein
VLELDVHAGPELVEVEACPVDADRVSDSLGFFGGRPSLLGHVFFLPKLLKIFRNSLATSRGLITIGAS